MKKLILDVGEIFYRIYFRKLHIVRAFSQTRKHPKKNFQVPATMDGPAQDVRLSDDPGRPDFRTRRRGLEPRLGPVCRRVDQRADDRKLRRERQ
jgi:hypothetical protein